jgi:ABC-type multidrug transport system ATPase subunit
MIGTPAPAAPAVASEAASTDSQAPAPSTDAAATVSGDARDDDAAAQDHLPADTDAIGDPAASPTLRLVPQEDPALKAMRSELEAMRVLMERQLGELAVERLRGSPARAAVLDALLAYGCDDALAQAVASRIDPRLPADAAHAAMLGELARLLSVHRAEPLDDGGVIALVGPTGAGKTTIVNLLTRFYEIDSGRITIDGQDIRQIAKDDLRRQLGIVLQDTFLFAGSVMDNIRYGRLDAADDEVVAAAKLANADQFIHRLPQGYATPLSERGSNLSQGQRQLLAIARAILADPRILILDEATSSVDTRTEQHIQEAMLRLMAGRTSFVIAHRLSTIRDADQILVIDQGEIVERGTHAGLLARQGFYARLYASQFEAGARHGEVRVGVEQPAQLAPV